MRHIISTLHPPKKYLILSILLLCVLYSTWSYTRIDNLTQEDSNFSALQKEISLNSSTPTFYEYILKKDETLLSISNVARVSISSLITINRSFSIDSFKEGDTVIIPSSKGTFLSIRPASDIEYLINYRLFDTLTFEKPLFVTPVKSKKADAFYFLHNQVLTKQEYYLWSNDDFRVPVLQGYISSYYGNRKSPISGYVIFHNGIDIASKSGTEIFASKSGTVIQDGYHKVFGYFIIIQHDQKYKTLYGHLLDVKVLIGDTVQAGEHIAYMGTTGASTGPHLHFEIHLDDKAIDPLPLLKIN